MSEVEKKADLSYTKDFIRDVPKSDLHVHLDGSLRLETLIDLAKSRRVSLPSYTVEGLRELVFKDQYQSLKEYLYGFFFTGAVMQDAEALERIAYEFAWDCINEGTLYVEVRFAPQLHINDQLNMEDVLVSINKGMARARQEYNLQAEVMNDEKPPFEYGLIVCAMRRFGPEFSSYYRKLYDVHPYSGNRELFPVASLELARGTVHIRDTLGLPIVGFDLAGEEAGYPAEHHQEAFDYAHRHFLKKTVHAGEAFGPESIFQAITDLKADRVGHGYYLFDQENINSKAIDDPGRYVQNLAQYIADRRITIEVCLTSNMQTNPRITDLKNHSFRLMRMNRLSTAICTDNRTVSNTSMTDELYLAATTFKLDRRELKNTVIYGFKRSFFPGSYIEKRNYVRSIIDHYEKAEKKHFGNFEPKH